MKKNYLQHFNPKIIKMIKEIGQEADRTNQSAYVVGGCVRDIFLKRENLDLDIVVEGDAGSIARRWRHKYSAPLKEYDRFGTATVYLNGDIRIDFARARQETYPYPAALPVVRPGSIQEDLFRRDFTINAMAIRINDKNFGELVDVYHGLEDLKKGKIRVLHTKSFIDDPTRILRAVRFEQRFHFRLESLTSKLLTEAMQKNALSAVKPERYFAEFKKVLGEEHPGRCLKRLGQIGALRHDQFYFNIRPAYVQKIVRGIGSIKRKPYFSEAMDRWLIYFMSLMAPESQPAVEKLCTLFNLKRSDRQKILPNGVWQSLLTQLKGSQMRPSQIYHILKPLSLETIIFMRLISPQRNVHQNIDRFLTRYNQVGLTMNGNDLKRLGLVDGKRIGEVLKYLLDQKVDGKIKTKSDERVAARRFIGQ